MSVTNLLISGVGGQGLVLSTKIVASAAFHAGYDVKTSDVIGLSQRGGMVWGSVRFGQQVHTPLIPTGQGDVMVAMEKMEALRWMHLMKGGARIILNQLEIFPNRVLLEKEAYPETPEMQLEAAGFEVLSVEAKAVARRLGNIKAFNSVLLGSLSQFLPFEEGIWLEAIKENVPSQAMEINLNAFKAGRENLW